MCKNIRSLFFLVIIIPIFNACSSSNSIEWIDWQLATQQAPYEKKGIVWLYTDWCPTSEFVMNNALKDKQVIDYINHNFYAITFNGQVDKSIELYGKQWNFVAQVDKQNAESIGYHELALALTDLDAERYNKSVPYPKLIFLDEQLNRIVPLSGNLTAGEMLTLLEFVNEELYKTMGIDEYMQRKAIEKFKKAKE